MDLDRNISELIKDELMINEGILKDIRRLVSEDSEFAKDEYKYLYVLFLNGMLKEFSKGLHNKVMKRVKKHTGMQIIRYQDDILEEPSLKWVFAGEKRK